MLLQKCSGALKSKSSYIDSIHLTDGVSHAKENNYVNFFYYKIRLIFIYQFYLHL